MFKTRETDEYAEGGRGRPKNQRRRHNLNPGSSNKNTTSVMTAVVSEAERWIDPQKSGEEMD